MYNIKTLNKIAACGTDNFDKAKYTVADEIESPDAILVRSAVMHDMKFDKNLLAIARAGAGVNNIPVDSCIAEGICVFNTPGANANGVKELAIAAMLLAARDIKGGIDWVKSVKDEPDVAKLVEKGKSKFAGSEIKGETLGIIGLGAIGGILANAAAALGMNVIGCDPYLTVDAAWNISNDVKKVNSREEIYKNSDFISIHVPLVDNTDPSVNTKHMINKDTIALMKDGAVIINLARDALVNDDDMAEALKSGKLAKYVTDFPNAKTAGMEGAIAIPHLGASTEESEDNCAVMAVRELIDYIENGNITNSVNLPNASMNAAGTKVCVIHKNVPAVISGLTSAVSSKGLNIENMLNKSKKDYAYTMMDINGGDVPADMADVLNAIDGVIRVRVIK